MARAHLASAKALRAGRSTPTPRSMQVTLLAFAQARDRLGFRERAVECAPAESARAVLARVAPDFDVTSLRVAVDGEYHDWDDAIGEVREIALIPPVSGG